MWYLVCPNKGGRSYRLTKEKNQHLVSRTGGDITLNGDQSVSRKHAMFTFETDTDNRTVVKIKDLESKYGTYINESFKLQPNHPHQLVEGDVITFGAQWNEWSFHSKPLVITTSTMSNEAKTNLRHIITELGGTVVGDWQESCSHLTMTEILLTAKVVCALASGAPIVTPDYWENFKEAIDEQRLPPNYEEFIPPLKESILNKNKVSFAVNETRRKLFYGKRFVFSSEKQLKKYKTIVEAAGGSCQTLLDCETVMEELFEPHVIVMQYTADTQPLMIYNNVLRELRIRGLRPIPETEIGLAVLMCSLDNYCNMKYNVVRNVLERVVMSQIKCSEVLAEDSQKSLIEPVTVKTEASAVKTEGLELSNASHNPVVSIMESSSLSSVGSGSLRDLLNNEQTLPCGFGQDSTENVTPLEESASYSMDPGPSRKRVQLQELEEPPTKRCLPEEKVQEPKEKNNCSINNFIMIGEGSCNLMNTRIGINGKEDTSFSMMSKRKFNEIDSEQNNQPLKKSKKVKPFSALGLDFSDETESFTSKVPSTLEVRDDDQWMRESKESLRAVLSSDWGARLKEIESRWPKEMKDIGFGMVVKMANLVVREKASHNEAKYPVSDPSVVNFKKFRKAKPSGSRASLPVIIGESDLAPYAGGGQDF